MIYFTDCGSAIAMVFLLAELTANLEPGMIGVKPRDGAAERHEPDRVSRGRIKRLRGDQAATYRLRVGDYRVFYGVSAAQVTAIDARPARWRNRSQVIEAIMRTSTSLDGTSGMPGISTS